MVGVLLTPEQHEGVRDDWERLNLAKHNLREHFSFVGLTESFDETVVMLKQMLGWKTFLYQHKENVTAHRPRRDEIPAAIMEMIIEHYWADILLYEYAKNLHAEIYNSMDEEYFLELERYRLLKKSMDAASKLSEEENYLAAMQMLRTAMEIDPESADLHKDLGKLLAMNGEYLKSLLAFAKALELNPYDGEAYGLYLRLRQETGGANLPQMATAG